jgi:biotin operon repressor
MSTNIYHTNNRTRLQAAVREAAEWSEFTYQDDPDYNAFCAAIRAEVEKQQIQRTGKDGPELDTVRKNKLYGVWYMSAALRTHWKTPSKRSENDILWILYNRGWSYGQGGCAVIAWWRIHHRTVTPTMLEQISALANRVWDEFEEKKMKKKMETQQDSLRNRIIWFLQQQPATTAFLAKKLTATSKAVDSHLYRLRKEGIVVRQSWGLYALAGAAPPDAKPTPSSAAADDGPMPTTDAVTGHNATARTDSWTLDDIDDGVAEPNGMPSMSCREPCSDEADGLEWADLGIPTAEPREMPTAEPRLSRW